MIQERAEIAEIAERVFLLREDRGWSQTRLAKEAGISITTVSSLERGYSQKITSPTMRKLARALDMTIEELVAPKDK
jgi:transcriptional regulator with XRE-family HTH domain